MFGYFVLEKLTDFINEFKASNHMRVVSLIYLIMEKEK